MRVLLVAYGCGPSLGSEKSAGWEWAKAAARHHEVWLVTRLKNACAVEVARRSVPNLRTVYVTTPRLLEWAKKDGRAARVHYLVWTWLAARKIRLLHQDVDFDVAHHVTLAADWLPSAASILSGVPLVWGPVGGAGAVPLPLWKWLGGRGVVRELLRAIVPRALRRFVGRRTAQRAELVVAQNADVAAYFRRYTQASVVTEPNVALDISSSGSDKKPVVDVARRRVAIFGGRLIPLKGLALAIAALAHPAAEIWDLHLYGEGPDAERLKRLVRKHELDSRRVQFLGATPREAFLARVEEADALLFPSLHDAAGWTVAEAVALGTPVICLDIGGPPIVAHRTGDRVLKASAATPEHLARALETLPVGPLESSTRWSADRLADLTARWYEGVRH